MKIPGIRPSWRWTVIFGLFALLMNSCHKSDCSQQPADCTCKQFTIYAEGVDSIDYKWWPMGWMGSYTSLNLNTNFAENPHQGGTCIQIRYDTNNVQRWAGIYWLNGNSWNGPGNNVYNIFNICNTCKYKVTFWCRGETGGEKVEMKIGGVDKGKDSVLPAISAGILSLSKSWQQFEIVINTASLSNLVGAFCVVTSNKMNPSFSSITFYLDDINYEVSN